MYHREDISKFLTPNYGNRVTCWSMSADIHVKKSLQFVEAKLKEENFRWKPLNKTVDHPFYSQFYFPELAMNEDCNNDKVQFYQSLVGIMRWLYEIGRIDILTETLLLLTFVSAPRVRHLHQTLHVFKYTK